MALKSTIYKFELAVSDLDRNYYDTLSLTVAQHPSESVERMMVRLLAYCLNAGEGIEFSKGLSDAYEPDLWSRAPDRRILLWVDVGEPATERIRKAAGRVVADQQHRGLRLRVHYVKRWWLSRRQQ